MILRAQTPLIAAFIVSGVVLFSIFIGQSVVTMSYFVPFALVLGTLAFLAALTSTELAMIMLIYAMLLSPELTLGAVSRYRHLVIRFDDIIVVTFTLAWLTQAAIHRKALIVKTPLNRYIGFYCFAFFVATAKGVITSDVRLVSGFFNVLKYLEYFFVYYLVAGATRDKKTLRSCLIAFIVTYAIVMVYAGSQIGSTIRVTAPFERQGGYEGEPNTLGGYQVLILGVILGLLSHFHFRRWRWPLVGLIVLSLIPFAFTLSRSSYIAIIPMYLTVVIFHRFRGRNILLGTLIILTILAIYFFPENVRQRLEYTFIPEYQETIKPAKLFGVTLDPSSSARLNDYNRLMGIWKKKPLFGYGLTGMGFVDGQYILVLIESGALGFIAFILLLGAIFRNTLRIYRNSRDELYKGLALGFLGGHVGMIVHAITANTFVLIRVMEPYWFLAALVMIIPRLEKEQENSGMLNEAPAAPYPKNARFLANYGNT